MGRKKKMLTPEQIDERKKKWWGEERNARRRERYRSDPAYRQKAIQQSRKKFEDRDVNEDAQHLTQVRDKIASYGQVREVSLPDGTVRQMLVLTSDELATVLGRTPNMLFRWRSSGKVPYGILQTRVGKTNAQAYSVPEVAAMVDVLKDHFTERYYYHDSHTETIQRLFTQVINTRRSMGIHGGSTSQTEAETA